MSTCTSSLIGFIAFCYDMLRNLTANKEDVRLIIDRGLQLGEYKTGGLALRGKKDSALHESIDSNENVRCLCISQKFHSWDHFLTHTCSMKTHPGTSPVKNWLDSNDWQRQYPGFFVLSKHEQEEIKQSFLASSSGTMMRIWEEVFLTFLDYLQKSDSSPFKRLRAMFARK